MCACEYSNILIHNHTTYMFYFYIFYLTYSVLHGAIRRLVYDTRFAFYAVALNYVLAIILCVCMCVCVVYLFIIFYALIKSWKIGIQIWQVVGDKCAQIFVKLAPPDGKASKVSSCRWSRTSLGWWLRSLELAHVVILVAVVVVCSTFV